MYSLWFRSPTNEGCEEGLKVFGALGCWGRVAMQHRISIFFCVNLRIK